MILFNSKNNRFMLAGLPSANIFIRNVTTQGRGGIAIGSEMSGGVKNVTMHDVRLLGQRGVHMKTTRGPSRATFRVPLFAARTLNGTGQSRVCL